MEWISIDEVAKIAQKSKRTLQRYVGKLTPIQKSTLTKKIKNSEGGNPVLHLHQKLLVEWKIKTASKKPPKPQNGSKDNSLDFPSLSYEKVLSEKQEQIDFLRGELNSKNEQLEKSHQEKLVIIERLRESNILLGNLQQDIKKLNIGESEEKSNNDNTGVTNPPKTLEVLWLILAILLIVAIIVGLFLGI